MPSRVSVLLQRSMTALPEDWVELTDKELDRLDQIDYNSLLNKHRRLEEKAKMEFRGEGALTVKTVPADRCHILGHQWVLERLHTVRCRTCNFWKSP